MTPSDEFRPTFAEINLNNLTFNLNSVKNFIGQKLNYMGVVKANAYGHGAIECAKTLENAGIDCLAVALTEEGLELRKNGIKIPIICLGGFWAGQENLLLENNLTPVIFRLDLAEKLNRSAFDKKIIADIHLKIDTGMGRLGIRFDEVKEFFERLKNFHNLNVKGIMTHFAAADNLRENDFTNLQINRFYEAVAICEEKGFKPVYKDMANSPGAVAHSKSRGNLVRLGGILYGLGRDVLPKDIDKPELKAVMSVHTEISQLKQVLKGETLGYSRTYMTTKDSIIATIPIGYYDGYRRDFSNKSSVIIKQTLAPVVGRISMDWTIIDVTDIPNVKVDEKVIIIGCQGDLRISAEDLAETAYTISYEITCGISDRVRRIYK